MISVCIATYNGERFIERQVTSILSQINAEDEVVVADDGSTDNTLAILRGLNDPRIRIVDGAHRHSPTWNFEKALKEARGEYIFLSDQDDVWMSEKVAVTMKYLQKYDCVVSDNVIVDAEDGVIADSFYCVSSTAYQSFSNEEKRVDKLYGRYQLYIEGARVARRNPLIRTMVLVEVLRHTLALTARTRRIKFIHYLIRNFR